MSLLWANTADIELLRAFQGPGRQGYGAEGVAALGGPRDSPAVARARTARMATNFILEAAMTMVGRVRSIEQEDEAREVQRPSYWR
jgi:hypothetical protein